MIDHDKDKHALLHEKIAAAVAQYAAMTPEQKAEQHAAQRESFVRSGRRAGHDMTREQIVARLAELDAKIEAATSWGAALGAMSEEASELRASLRLIDARAAKDDTKFTTPCALPTPHERELLTILIEEAAEVQQRATKLLRFGRDEAQPGQPFSNRERLSHEVGDLRKMIALALKANLLDLTAIADGEDRKEKQLAKFMQTGPAA